MSAPPDSPSQRATPASSREPSVVPPSSPPAHDGKSFVSHAADDDEEDSHMPDAEPDEAPKKGARKVKQGNEKADKAERQIGKIRHLKKDDGEPLWRKDIQYDFLKAVFDNEQKVFTNSYEPEKIGKQNFADLYIDTMSRSSKTSKVLRDKLLSDREAAKGMAMVCLLVNMGRMNTTLNFFPEMRAQLRTYHAIPSLQAHQDPHAYKQLQDAPRLKSILKGGAEDRGEPYQLDEVKQPDVPRTNPVNLIFVMCNAAAKIAELHFPRKRELHDLIMKTRYTSESRAKAFLWLMWFHLESDFTEEGCDENPFGPGVDYGLDVANQGIPELELMPEDAEPENVDTPEEIEFGREKQKTRSKILEMDQAYLNEREHRRGKMRVSHADDGPAILPRIRPSKHESDLDSSRSTPPPKNLAKGGPGGSNRRGAPLKYQIFDGSSPARPGAEGMVARKPRPPTAHQLAVERNRHERVEHILDRGVRKRHRESRKKRKQDGATYRAWRRVGAQADPLEDSDDEDATPRNIVASDTQPFREKGIGGLSILAAEQDDYGEEVSAYAAALRRATRRLERWTGRDAELGVVAPVKKQKPVGSDAEAKHADGLAGIEVNGEANGDVVMDDMELDDGDQTALAMDEGVEEDIDDPDRTEVMADSDVD